MTRREFVRKASDAVHRVDLTTTPTQIKHSTRLNINDTQAITEAVWRAIRADVEDPITQRDVNAD